MPEPVPKDAFHCSRSKIDNPCFVKGKPCAICGVSVCSMCAVHAGGAGWSEHRCDSCDRIVGNRPLPLS